MKTKTMNSRYFNQITINGDTVTKISKNNFSKLEKEYHWFQYIPEICPSLSGYIPDNLTIDHDNNSYSMKYYKNGSIYDYISNKKLFINNNKILKDIIDLLCIILSNFHNERCSSHNGKLDNSNLYTKKTSDRLSSIDNYFRLDKYIINGEEYHIKDINNFVRSNVKRIEDSSINTAIHGDFIFSNILINDKSIHDDKSFVLIDPRGPIYGDSRYDAAKLRHSVHGGYEYIINDKYSLDILTPIEYNYKINFNYDRDKTTNFLDESLLMIDHNYILCDLKFIEGLLFYTMIPLHKENIKHQMIFFGQALKLFKECELELNGVNL